MPGQELNALIRKGLAEIERGNTLMALVHFEDAARRDDSPLVRSHLAYCLAKERRQMNKAATLCNEALQEEPGNTVHYLNLGRIYLLAGQKNRAIQTWRRGQKLGRNPQIAFELRKLGLRKPPVLKALGREHPVNRFLGKMLQKMGMR
ncbi:MAG TPA: tetratricopeptide repeat protein [Desulfuromonadales bacterium]|jgi:tetratricopeptide (TPR) repeat protein|nr:tetratricopeptide repeat protein [Desulfuromonadales bacterium]